MGAKPWPENDTKILKRMWRQGKTARDIADRLGKTRNAVLGKAHRLVKAKKLKRRNAGGQK